jgi:branched-chain amino acid transport system permease protein
MVDSAVRLLSYAFVAASRWCSPRSAWALGDVFFFRLATEALIFGGLALSVDLLLGRTGLLPLGQALFFGFGAYVSALVLKHLVAFVLALAMFIVLVSRGGADRAGGRRHRHPRQGRVFRADQLRPGQVVSKVVYNTRELGASDGIIGVPAPVSAGPARSRPASPLGFFLLVLLGMAALLAYGAAVADEHAVRRLLDAIRTNEHRRALPRLRPWRYKLGWLFVLAARGRRAQRRAVPDAARLRVAPS